MLQFIWTNHIRANPCHHKLFFSTYLYLGTPFLVLPHLQFMFLSSSFDARTLTEWSSETFNETGRVSVTRDHQPTAVTVTSLREDDEALYHCRVDFLLTQTRNVGVNLTVIDGCCFLQRSLSICFANKVWSKNRTV